MENSEDLKSCEIELQEYKGKTKPILAFSIVGLMFLLLLALVFVSIPEENKDMLNFLLGSVCGVVASVFGFYFGNSEKGKTK